MAMRHFVRAAAAATSLLVVAGLSTGISPASGTSSRATALQAGAQKVASSLTIEVSDATLHWPGKVAVRSVARERDGDPAAGAVVQLWARQAGSREFRVSSYTADSQGRLFASRRPEKKTYYHWQAPDSPVESATKRVTVRPRLTARTSAKRIPFRQTLVVSGASSPTRVGTPVQLQRKSGSRWRTVSRTTIKVATSSHSPTARYRLTFRASSRGARVFRVLIAKDAGRAAATAGPRRVTFV